VRTVDGVYDIGGMHGFGSVRTPDGDLTHHEPWEVRAQAVGLASGSISRAWIEGLGPAVYLGSSYYVRWLLAAEKSVVVQQRVEQHELDHWLSVFRADPASVPPKVLAPEVADLVRAGLAQPHIETPVTSSSFAVGDRARVRRMRPEHHHRCPRYVRGVEGEVERVVSVDPVPGTGPGEEAAEPVYTMRFASTDLWGDRADDDEPAFTVLVDLWERYLEPTS